MDTIETVRHPALIKNQAAFAPLVKAMQLNGYDEPVIESTEPGVVWVGSRSENVVYQTAVLRRDPDANWEAYGCILKDRNVPPAEMKWDNAVAVGVADSMLGALYLVLGYQRGGRQ